jgi:KipI family sensor histidine kinase inhibitor
MNNVTYQLVPNGDAGLSIVFNAPQSEQLSRKIHHLAKYCLQELSEFVTDIIPAYQSLTLCYPPHIKVLRQIEQRLRAIMHQELSQDDYESQIITIPVCYEPDYAPDLVNLAQFCGLSTEQVITLHSEQNYLVYMLGFSPGFLYLGGLNSKLTCPRKVVPSARVPKGSVGIGGGQTGIYSQATPGGWHIIGRTPISLFNPNLVSPCIAQPLDRVRFKPISRDEFSTWSKVS